MMPPESDKNGDAKAANPSQGDVHPETDLFCQLTGRHGLSEDQARIYITILKSWFGDILNGYAKQEVLNNLRSRVKEIENNFARKGDVEKIARDVFWFWGKVALGIVSAIIVAIGGAIWFFWEKIHPLLIHLPNGQ